MSWPTVSKGIFYEGYKKGASEGQSAGERPSPKANPSKFTPDTEKGRLVYPASKVNTEAGMRKPK